MAITINWATKVINVPKADLTLVQSNPTEIRSMDLNWFRLELKDLEDDFDQGMPFLDTHRHNTTVTVGGVELARVIEIINGYTITFEDGQYAVNLFGANSNVADVVNVNQVSVRSANSAGLVTSQAIEYGEYNGAVHIDVVNGESGSIYPIGTLRRPVDNVPDAILIAEARGFATLRILGDITLDTGDDVEGYIIIGQNPTKTTITINDGAETLGCEIIEASVTGNLDGNTILRNCVVTNLQYINGFIYNCMLNPGTVTLGGTITAHFLNCFSGVPGQSTPIIDMNGTTNDQDTPLAIRGYNGGIQLNQKTGSGAVSIDLVSGQVKIDSSCIDGNIVVRGNGKVYDTLGNHMHSGTYNGNLVLDNEANYGEHIHDMWVDQGLDPATSSTRKAAEIIKEEVWNALIADHNIVGSFGNFIQKKLLSVSKFLGLK